METMGSYQMGSLVRAATDSRQRANEWLMIVSLVGRTTAGS